jgi:hypothetical protein
MLIVPRRFASIGSQNPTEQGRRNREATVVFTGEKSVARIQQLSAVWIEHAELITLEQIKEMEKAIEPLRARFNEAAEAARQVDRLVHQTRVAADHALDESRSPDLEEAEDDDNDEIERLSDCDDQRTAWGTEDELDDELFFNPTEGIDLDNEPIPEDVKRDLAEDEENEIGPNHASGLARFDAADTDDGQQNSRSGGIRQRCFFPVGEAERLARLRESVARALKKASEVVDAEVGLREKKPSLVGRANAKLTTWEFAGSKVVLKRTHRYVCILDEIGKWGWARVAKTRISIIAPELILSNPVVLAGFRYRLGFEAVWQPSAGAHSNLKITVAPERDQSMACPLATIDCWFGLDLLDILNVHVREGIQNRCQSEADHLREWLFDNPQEFRQIVLPHVLSPFKYSLNLYGPRADSFFGPLGTRFSLRLASIDGYEVLIAQKERGSDTGSQHV